MMRALILSSRCTVEQRRALLELRAFLEGCGDTCEMLDWLSFLSDTVSEINAHSRKLVRRHIQELLAGAFQAVTMPPVTTLPDRGSRWQIFLI